MPGWVETRPGHLHNNLVTIAAETGIPSALAYLAFVGAFFMALSGSSAAHTGPARGVALGAIGAMAALFVAGLFEYNFGDVEVLMATLVVATLPFAAARAAGRRLESGHVEPPPRPRVRPPPRGRRRVAERRCPSGTRARRGPDATAMSVSELDRTDQRVPPETDSEHLGQGRGLGFSGDGRVRALFFLFEG